MKWPLLALPLVAVITLGACQDGDPLGPTDPAVESAEIQLDAVRAGLRDGRRLATVWAAVAAVVGLFSVLASLGDPLAARGPGLRSTDLSVSLGEFNLVGGVIVLAVAVAMILGIRQGNRTLGLVAAGVAVLGALSLHAQLGFSDPLLGGTPTSAALLISLAVVAFFTASRDRASSA